MTQPVIQINEQQWSSSRAGASAGRGFRYQDAMATWLALEAWAGLEDWLVVVPEGVDDITLHGNLFEIRAQAKSRHDPQSQFSLREVAQFLAKIVAGSNTAANQIRFALLLERPVAGLQHTGWAESLLNSAQDLAPFKQYLAHALNNPDSSLIDQYLQLTHLIVEPEPVGRAIRLIEKHGVIPAALGRLAVQYLRQDMGECADANFMAPASSPAHIDIARVQHRIDTVLATVSPDSLDEPIKEGICEIVDFNSAVAIEDFYTGMNVTPGHIGAGLVFERPAQTTAILNILTRYRVALIAGPSGAGKSALAWLTAYATRHYVRWYKIKRLPSKDVFALIRHTRLYEATATRPVGFVVDDVGRDSLSGWDDFVKEIIGEPGIWLFGTVREEDIFTLSTANEVQVVRPTMDEALASRVWEALSVQGLSLFPHWREPLEPLDFWDA